MTEEEFEQVKAGEWVTPVRSGYLMQCCDCGLVHKIYFRVIKPTKKKKLAAIQSTQYKVQLRAYREGNPGW